MNRTALIFLLLASWLGAPNLAHANWEDESDLAFDEVDADIVEFHIAKGTDEGAWNTKDTVVEVKVGQTLRIYNDDTIDHYLHTPGRPCAHGSGPFGPGRYYDCKVSKTADPDNDVLYDHQFGNKSRFYVKATN